DHRHHELCARVAGRHCVCRTAQSWRGTDGGQTIRQRGVGEGCFGFVCASLGHSEASEWRISHVAGKNQQRPIWHMDDQARIKRPERIERLALRGGLREVDRRRRRTLKRLTKYEVRLTISDRDRAWSGNGRTDFRI